MKLHPRPKKKYHIRETGGTETHNAIRILNSIHLLISDDSARQRQADCSVSWGLLFSAYEEGQL